MNILFRTEETCPKISEGQDPVKYRPDPQHWILEGGLLE
jgi:hypothetical protein